MLVHKKHVICMCHSATISHSPGSQVHHEFCPPYRSSFPNGRWAVVLPPSCTDLETTSKKLRQSSAELSGHAEIPNALWGGSTSLSRALLPSPGRDPESLWLQMISLPANPSISPHSNMIFFFFEGTSYFLFISVEKTTKKKTLRIAWIF